MLHWLWPEQVPVNDSYVREALGIDAQGKDPYRKLVQWVFEQAARLEPQADEFVGLVEPRTVLRAIDTAVWWMADSSRD